jgi:hypothetical protein
LRSILVGFVAALGIAAYSTIASAQAAQNVPPLELTAQIGYLPPSCFDEGGPHFRDALLSTWAVDAGVLLPVVRWFALRGDVRLYVPLGRSAEARGSRARRIEFAGGLSIRL